MTVVVMTAQYFHNHHERALSLIQRLGCIPEAQLNQ